MMISVGGHYHDARPVQSISSAEGAQESQIRASAQGRRSDLQRGILSEHKALFTTSQLYMDGKPLFPSARGDYYRAIGYQLRLSTALS